MNNSNISKVIKILKREYKKFREPVVTTISKTHKPFHVLISTMLSLRTKDTVTLEASKRLFKVANSAEAILKLTPKQIEKLIYPVGFYKTKAKALLKTCKMLLKTGVPEEIDELLKLPGVGRKTANLVVALGFGKPAICVDTHVHRISNRLGYVKTKNPEETEFALRKKLPKKYWIIYNDLLVAYGQNICVPISPWCSVCKIRKFCPRVGVTKSR